MQPILPVLRRPSFIGLQMLDPRTSWVVKFFAADIISVDAIYSAFKVPIGAAVFQDFDKISLLTLCDLAAGVQGCKRLLCHACVRCSARLCIYAEELCWHAAGLIMSGRICVNFHTGLVVEHKGEEHLLADGPTVAKHYL